MFTDSKSDTLLAKQVVLLLMEFTGIVALFRRQLQVQQDDSEKETKPKRRIQ